MPHRTAGLRGRDRFGPGRRDPEDRARLGSAAGGDPGPRARPAAALLLQGPAGAPAGHRRGPHHPRGLGGDRSRGGAPAASGGSALAGGGGRDARRGAPGRPGDAPVRSHRRAGSPAQVRPGRRRHGRRLADRPGPCPRRHAVRVRLREQDLGPRSGPAHAARRRGGHRGGPGHLVARFPHGRVRRQPEALAGFRRRRAADRDLRDPGHGEHHRCDLERHRDDRLLGLAGPALRGRRRRGRAHRPGRPGPRHPDRLPQPVLAAERRTHVRDPLAEQQRQHGAEGARHSRSSTAGGRSRSPAISAAPRTRRSSRRPGTSFTCWAGPRRASGPFRST